MADTRTRHPWEVPDCPECGGHLFVERSDSNHHDWQCHKCDAQWDEVAP